MKEKLLELIKQTGDSAEDVLYNEFSESFSRFIDNSWSGTEIRYYIDQDTNLLIKRVIDDSPLQSGGWIEMYVWFKNEWHALSNIADLFTYVIVNDELFLVEFDREFCDYGTVMDISIALPMTQSKPIHDFFRKSYGGNLLDELRSKSSEDVREFVLKEFDPAKMEHYVFDDAQGRYVMEKENAD